MAFHLLPFKYNTVPEPLDKVPFTDKQPKFVLRWVIRKPDYHILKNVGNAGKSGSEKSWGKERKEKTWITLKQGSVLHSLPCSGNQKGREEKVSCRRQIFIFVKYNFLSYLYHQCCHQLMETTDPCYPQKWFSVYFLLFQTSRKKQSRAHGQCPMGSDLFSSRGMAEQCKEGLNHPRGASLSRGCVAHAGHRMLCRSGGPCLENAALQELVQEQEKANLSGKVYPG